MREFPFAPKWNVNVTLRNELGNSIPIRLDSSNCQQFFASVTRETGNGIPAIPSSSWMGYLLYSWEKSNCIGYFSAVNSRRELRFRMETFQRQFTLLFAVTTLRLSKLNRPISLLISHLPALKVFHMIMPN